MEHFKSIGQTAQKTARGGVALLNRRIKQTLLSVILGTLLTTSSGFYTRSQIAEIKDDQTQIKQQLALIIANRSGSIGTDTLPPVRSKRIPSQVLQPAANWQSVGRFAYLGMRQGTATFAGFQTTVPGKPSPRFRHQRERVISAFAAWLPYEHQNALADSAIKGLTGAGFPTEGGWCQKWVRMSIQGAYGAKYNRYMRSSARLTGLAFIGSPYIVKEAQGTRPGDIAYKLHVAQGFGHTGIRGFGNVMLENTSWKGDGNGDARTARTLKEWGKADIWVRLPGVNGPKSTGSMGGLRSAPNFGFTPRFNVVEQQHASE